MPRASVKLIIAPVPLPFEFPPPKLPIATLACAVFPGLEPSAHATSKLPGSVTTYVCIAPAAPTAGAVT